MLETDTAVLEARAQLLAKAIGGRVVQSTARVGGGALPLLELHGPAVSLDHVGAPADVLAAALRGGEPALIARIEDAGVLLDPRTLTDAEVELAATAVAIAVATIT